MIPVLVGGLAVAAVTLEVMAGAAAAGAWPPARAARGRACPTTRAFQPLSPDPIQITAAAPSVTTSSNSRILAAK